MYACIIYNLLDNIKNLLLVNRFLIISLPGIFGLVFCQTNHVRVHVHMQIRKFYQSKSIRVFILSDSGYQNVLVWEMWCFYNDLNTTLPLYPLYYCKNLSR